MQVTKEFTFDSAHFLPNYYGQCERMHGHTYKLQVTVEGELGENGLVIDFVVLKRIVKRQVLDKLDHYTLNDIIENPTCENVTRWIWDQLVDLKEHLRKEMNDPNLPQSITYYFRPGADDALDKTGFSDRLRLAEVKLWETPTSFVTYIGVFDSLERD